MGIAGGDLPVLAMVAPVIKNRAELSAEHQSGIGEVEAVPSGSSGASPVETDVHAFMYMQ